MPACLSPAATQVLVDLLSQALQYHMRGQLSQAERLYRTALRWDPTCPEAHHNLGVVYQGQGHTEAALQCYQEAIRLQPDYAAAHYNAGVLWQARGHYEAAVQAYQHTLRLQPDFRAAYHNLGVLWQEQGAHQQALAAYEQALRLDPDDVEAQWNRALLWLAQGRLAEGWRAYEWRWRGLHSARHWPMPRWDGSPLQGQTILVWAEQGLGDEILFASCLPDLLEQAGHCVLECDPRLAPLFTRSFPGATVQGSPRQASPDWLAQVPPADVQLPSGSLPGYLRPGLQAFPGRAGYLRPDALRQAHYQARLAQLGPGLKVGIAWRSRAHRAESHYTRLQQWRPLCTLSGVHLINLQYDDTTAECVQAQQQWGVSLHTWEDLDVFNDLDGLAALMAALDLVIAPETSVAALAGALGTPVWRLTPYGNSWTALGTAHSPWFPSMRVYCQPQPGAWDALLATVATDLAALVAQSGSRSSV
ncbi:MAG: tetratricopeptide repeat protein [Candidatus Tectimicrobiota bacterium]